MAGMRKDGGSLYPISTQPFEFSRGIPGASFQPSQAYLRWKARSHYRIAHVLPAILPMLDLCCVMIMRDSREPPLH